MGNREYLGEFEQVVLLALARMRGPAYGAEIHREILDRTGRDVSIPAVYVTLKRMERKGLVNSEVEDRPTGGRATRNYRILPAGKVALAQSRALLDQLWDGLGLEGVSNRRLLHARSCGSSRILRIGPFSSMTFVIVSTRSPRRRGSERLGGGIGLRR